MSTSSDSSSPVDPSQPQNLTGDHPGFELARQAAEQLRADSGIESYSIAVVLGSGWAATATKIGQVVHSIDIAQLPGFPATGVAGHNQQIHSVQLTDSEDYALVFGTRTHYYESRDAQAVAHPVRMAAALGAQTLVLTNGCGGISPDYAAGEPVLISDHINLTGDTPIAGPNFVDLTDLYSPRIREIARQVDSSLQEGVYVQFSGPQYETPAEVRMAQILGGDLVGMSTALDAIAARQAGLEVFGISLVTNPAAGTTDQALSHEEVIAAGERASERISTLLAQIVARI